MSENKGLVKCVLGFLLAILVIAGGIFGFDVKVEVEDLGTDETTLEEDVALDESTDKTENVADTEEAQVDTTDEVVDTEDSPADSTPTEDTDASVDESVEGEVTKPTDNTEDVVTEGDNKNA